jgi:MYXO-CTERM domain-containing protein
LLYDAYFGVRVNGAQAWLTRDALDADKSGYAGWQTGAVGGTGIATMVQIHGPLEITTYVFAPRELDRAGFVMALAVRNVGAPPATGVSIFSLHNFHLGFGRPGVMTDIGETGETVGYDGDLSERGFAGVVVARALTPAARHAGSYGGAAGNPYDIVQAGAPVDLTDLNGEAPVHDGSISAFQFDLGDLPSGETRWVGVAFAHHGDPFGAAEVKGSLNAYVASRNAQELVADEIAGWQTFQRRLMVPEGLSEGDATLWRHSAAMLSMAQVRESHTFLREWLSVDGEPRSTRFGATLGDPPANLPATVAHRGRGAVLASLPPGQWTVSWIRDGAYAVAAMAHAGMHAEARDALLFYLSAEAGRFQSWTELEGYGMPPYQISLVRYHGFGVEETDFNDFGPNLELDGPGLFLWALRRYAVDSGDGAFVSQHWETVATRVADVIVALVDPDTGLIRPDSSIWETHWNGRERSWTYTNITAARGLCDAAALAEREGDATRSEKYRAAGTALISAIAERLTDASGALASNAEELAAGTGYWDAAVLDGIAMELFDPAGPIAKATFAGIESELGVPAGAGWARNDDRSDSHGAQGDLSPWGSEYDSGEWVIVDMRGAVAAWLMQDQARAERLTNWVRDQALANYLEVAEVFDEGNGHYKFNSPMMGFGAGAFLLAHRARVTEPDPACGAYYQEGQGGQGGNGVAGPPPVEEAEGCGCRVAGREPHMGWAAPLLLLCALAFRRRRVMPSGGLRGDKSL